MGLTIGGIGNNLADTIAGRGANGFVLDYLGGGNSIPVVAYSTRKLRTPFVGAALRVRRSSDNAEADIGFLGNGDLNEASLLTFVGANSGFISKLYDQSGHGLDMTQAILSAQPSIVTAGVINRLSTATNRPVWVTDGISQQIESGNFTMNQPYVLSLVMQFVGVDANQYILHSVGSFPDAGIYRNGIGDINLYAGTVVAAKTGVVAGDKAILTGTYNGAASELRYNGVSSGALSIGTSALDGLAIGNNGGVGNYSASKFGDVLIFNYVLSTGDRLALEANQKAYWGTP